MSDRPQAIDVRAGDIWQSVPLPDPQGRNAKSRPFVVVAVRDGVARCVAVTGTLVPTEPASLYVPLPWAADGRARTGLKKECWAYLGWVRLLQRSDLDRKRGYCPPGPAAAIAAGLVAAGEDDHATD